MAHQGGGEPSVYEEIGDRLKREFVGVHPPETVTRCVAAARYGAQEVTGAAAPGLVEKIARKHLQVLAMVAAEKQRAERRKAERMEAERQAAESREAERREREARRAERTERGEEGSGPGPGAHARSNADRSVANDARGSVPNDARGPVADDPQGSVADDARDSVADDARHTGRHRAERRPDGRIMPAHADDEEHRPGDFRADLPHTPHSTTGNAP